MSEKLMMLRKIAGETAAQLVQAGMTLGVGTGRTTRFFIDSVGERYQHGEIKDIRAVPTSVTSADLLTDFGIPIVSLADHPILDLAVDGADEVDPQLNLIKGLGRALMREKIVEIYASRLLIIVDEYKIVKKLGSICSLPVEILPFEAARHIQWLNSLGCKSELWIESNGSPVVTDNGNYLARCWFENGISDSYQLASELDRHPGILEHGLFLDMATDVIVAGEDGIHQLRRGQND
jgi:ribose 5-phosphate isomerase A